MPLCDRFFKPPIREKSAGMGGGNRNYNLLGKKNPPSWRIFFSKFSLFFGGETGFEAKKWTPRTLRTQKKGGGGGQDPENF